jgi:hypothetical protein
MLSLFFHSLLGYWAGLEALKFGLANIFQRDVQVFIISEFTSRDPAAGR